MQNNLRRVCRSLFVRQGKILPRGEVEQVFENHLSFKVVANSSSSFPGQSIQDSDTVLDETDNWSTESFNISPCPYVIPRSSTLKRDPLKRDPRELWRDRKFGFFWGLSQSRPQVDAFPHQKSSHTFCSLILDCGF